MLSFQGVGIDVYRGVIISSCWNRGVPLYKEVSSFQGVGIEGFHCIEVSSFQGVGIEGFHCIQRVHISRFQCTHSWVYTKIFPFPALE